MIIYLAGPIRPSDSSETLESNIAKGKEIALKLWKMGYVVFCPHANSDLPVSIAEKENIDWVKKDLNILSRCDALVVMQNWEKSSGVKAEIRFAHDNYIPVYFYPELPHINDDEDDAVIEFLYGKQVISCGKFKMVNDDLFVMGNNYWKHVFPDYDIESLYKVLHTWSMTNQWSASKHLLERIQAAENEFKGIA